MQKLPPGEALRRHNERNRIKNEYRKANKIKTIIVLTEKRKAEMREYARAYRAKKKVESSFKPKGDPARLKQMREYAKNARALAKAQTSEERTLHQAAKADRTERMKAARIAARAEKKEASRIARNQRDRAKRQAEKDAGIRIDKRLKENMTYVHHKVANAKPKEPRRMRTPKEKKMGKVINEPKPMRITNNSTEGKIALVISQKLTVFIRPDQDLETVKAKYKNFF